MNLSSAFRLVADVAGRYYLIAGSAFLLFYVLLRKPIGWKKIQVKFPRRKDYQREIIFSTLSMAIIALPVVALQSSRRILPHTYFYTEIPRYGWVYFFAAFPLMFLIHDTYFYWLHRAIHHPRLFRIVHLMHHRSVNPSPWAAYSMHPVEAGLESLIYIIFLFVMPVHGWHFVGFFLLSLTYSVYAHVGFEMLPKGFNRHWLGRWINTSVCHNQHHRCFKGNYGLYFLFWDRLMGTLREDYDESYAEVTGREMEKREVDVRVPA